MSSTTATAVQAYAHVYPVLLLSTVALRFPALVADPVAFLSQSLLPLAVLQAAYVGICVVPAAAENSPGQGKPAPKKKRPGQKNAAAHEASPVAEAFRKLVPPLLSLLPTVLLGIPIMTIVIILFGAPVTSHLQHTLLLASHVALLAGPALVGTRGVDTKRWRAVISLETPLDEAVAAALGTLIGMWIGAVPIPLDWDREWQKWPVTVVVGAYVGWAIGKAAGLTFLKGRIIELE
ncbi:GPI biosynthesis protein Pig-F [Lineolata rhizophorae]|uniref:GPI biosynthesis protein Pig-F n=1 Tax=Lineolata rhizophorae TaxID=578093 RepID=A0A6A6NPN6_9PEZI|nr:GPI biosynthesis protein Pig-F [Lineolata rhizophorae]